MCIVAIDLLFVTIVDSLRVVTLQKINSWAGPWVTYVTASEGSLRSLMSSRPQPGVSLGLVWLWLVHSDVLLSLMWPSLAHTGLWICHTVSGTLTSAVLRSETAYWLLFFDPLAHFHPNTCLSFSILHLSKGEGSESQPPPPPASGCRKRVQKK